MSHTQTQKDNRSSLTRFAWISIGASILTIALKSGAYLLTNSVGFLSDAVESLVNLVAGIMALAMLTVAARPADDDHAYGHSKAEYFSSTTEGILILVAAGGIISTAVQRFFNPQPLEQLGIGLIVSAAASGASWARDFRPPSTDATRRQTTRPPLPASTAGTPRAAPPWPGTRRRVLTASPSTWRPST